MGCKYVRMLQKGKIPVIMLIKETNMKKYVCGPCAYVYDPAAEGTPFEDLPADWVCPVCGAGKDLFSPEE